MGPLTRWARALLAMLLATAFVCAYGLALLAHHLWVRGDDGPP